MRFLHGSIYLNFLSLISSIEKKYRAKKLIWDSALCLDKNCHFFRPAVWQWDSQILGTKEYWHWYIQFENRTHSNFSSIIVESSKKFRNHPIHLIVSNFWNDNAFGKMFVITNTIYSYLEQTLQTLKKFPGIEIFFIFLLKHNSLAIKNQIKLLSSLTSSIESRDYINKI